MSSHVLVTGGAGYIGSQVCLALLDAGFRVTILDDLSTGHRALLPDGAAFVEGDIASFATLAAGVASGRPDVLIHMAAKTSVPESVAEPERYYDENTVKALALVGNARAAGIGRFVFSSTAAVYAADAPQPVAEEGPLLPESPYGFTKLAVERYLADLARAGRLSAVALRYFNVAGADPGLRAGPMKPDPEHLIGVVVDAALGLRGEVPVFGTDYATRDGTAVRDYVHVADIADAHVAAVRHLTGGGASATLNCGYGRGYTVREVVRAAEAVSGARLATVDGPRRPGDIPVAVSDPRRIGAVLGWAPRLARLETIIEHHLRWRRTLHSG